MLGPVFFILIHCDVILWHIDHTPYADATKLVLSGINAVARAMRAVWSSKNVTELKMEALFNVRSPSGKDLP